MHITRTHWFTFKVFINLCLEFLLYFRVQGQQVGGEGQGVGSCLIPSQEEHNGVSHNLLIGKFLLFPTFSVSSIHHQLKEVLVLKKKVYRFTAT